MSTIRPWLAAAVLALAAGASHPAPASAATQEGAHSQLLLALAGRVFRDRDYSVEHGTFGVLFVDFLDWAIYRDEKPRMVAVRVLSDDLPERMPAGLRAVFERHFPPQVLARIAAAYKRLEEGDLIVVNEEGGRRATIALNGEPVATTGSVGLTRDVAASVMNPMQVVASEATGLQIAEDRINGR